MGHFPWQSSITRGYYFFIRNDQYPRDSLTSWDFRLERFSDHEAWTQAGRHGLGSHQKDRGNHGDDDDDDGDNDDDDDDDGDDDDDDCYYDYNYNLFGPGL